MRDPFETLGLPRSATTEDIKKAFRSLAKLYHADAGKSSDDARFIEITEAYHLLVNPEKRAAWEADELFGALSGAFTWPPAPVRTRRATRRGAARGADVHAIADLDLQYVFKGVNLSYTYSALRTCMACAGTGCHACDHGRRATETGWKIMIPKGFAHGDVMRIKNGGDDGLNGGPRGNLVLTLRIKDHPKIERRGRDLTARFSVHASTIRRGGIVAVDIPGSPVRVRFPPAAGPSRLKVAGKGLPDRNGVAGDLFIELQVKQ